MASAPKGQGHPAASPAPGHHAAEHGTRQRPPRPARQAGTRWAGRDDCGLPEHPDLSCTGAAEFIRARTRWDPPRTHGPTLPGAAVQTANGALCRVEQTKRFAILPVSWEPGGDQVTPTRRLKRQAIAARYAQRHRVPVRRSLRGGASRRSWPRWPCQSSRAQAEPPRRRQPPILSEPTSWHDRNRAEPDPMRAASRPEGMMATAPESAIT